MAAEQAKDRGNRSFAAANFREAIAGFSEAIAHYNRDPSSGGALHVYYSNRSAAHLKLGDAAEALADADKCVALKRDWAKGYSRKGAALFSLGRFADAFRAYTDGLAVAPSNVPLQEGLASVQARMTAPSSSTTYRSSVPSATSKTLRQFLAGDKSALFQLLQFAVRALMVVSFVVYWLPFVPVASTTSFSTFFKLALFNYASFLLFTHGRPQWKASYGQRLVLDPALQSFFYSLVFWVSTPYGLAMVPVLLVETVHLVAYSANLLVVLQLEQSSAVASFTTTLLLPLTAAVLSEPSFAALPTATKWTKVYQRVPQVAATVEVAIGLALLLELLTPTRNFVLTMLFWQQLRVRYMISPPLQDAFRHMHASIGALTANRRCPAFVATGYTKIRTFAASMVELQQPGAAGTGGGGAQAMASRCTMM